MADTSVTPGIDTTEYKLAKVASILCVIVALVGSIIAALPSDVQSRPIVGVIMTVVGVIGKVLTANGYGASRAAVKAAESAAVTVVATDATPKT